MRGTLIATMLAAAALGSPARAGTCTMAAAEQAWVNRAFTAWRYMAEERLRLGPAKPATIIVFDSKCRFEADGNLRPQWTGESHVGSIRLPDGTKIPAQVTSFAGQKDEADRPFFVMALPSIWKAARLPIAGDPIGLTGIFLHEFSHVRHAASLKPVFEAAEASRKMPDDFDDDSLQARFKSDPAYVAVIENEIGLLYRAAAEPDAVKAKTLAAEALALMEARQKRWFVGDDSHWKNYDDLFLTMEGVGQWTAYAWLIDAKGGGIGTEAAQNKVRGGRKWWSQEEGLALFLVIDRFVPGWSQRAFAAHPALGIDLLGSAIASQI